MLAVQPFPVGLLRSLLSGLILFPLVQLPWGTERVPGLQIELSLDLCREGLLCLEQGWSGQLSKLPEMGESLGVIKAHVSLMKAPGRAP